MLELPHAIIGATIATRIGNPFLAIPLAFLSNFVLDILPHWNPHLFTEIKNNGRLSKKTLSIVFTDVALSIILGTIIAFSFYPDLGRILLVFVCIGVAVSADLIEAPFYLLGWRHKFFTTIIGYQRKIQCNVSAVWGILSQAIFLAVCFYLILSA